MHSRQRRQFVRHKIHLRSAILIAPHTEQFIPVSTKPLPTNRGFSFEPIKQANLTLFAHLIDYVIVGVLARNDIVPRRF